MSLRYQLVDPNGLSEYVEARALDRVVKTLQDTSVSMNLHVHAILRSQTGRLLGAAGDEKELIARTICGIGRWSR